MDLTPYRSFLVELARQSGDFIRPYFAQPGLQVDTKSDDTPVTLADRGAEELMRRLGMRPGADVRLAFTKIGNDFWAIRLI